MSLANSCYGFNTALVAYEETVVAGFTFCKRSVGIQICFTNQIFTLSTEAFHFESKRQEVTTDMRTHSRQVWNLFKKKYIKIVLTNSTPRRVIAVCCSSYEKYCNDKHHIGSKSKQWHIFFIYTWNSYRNKQLHDSIN